MIPIASDLLSTNLVISIYPTFGTSIYPEFRWSLPQEVSLLADIGTLDSSTGSIHLGVVAAFMSKHQRNMQV